MKQEEKLKLLACFKDNPFMAHKYLFPARRENASPDFHREIINLLHSTSPFVGLQAFRGAAKTTLVEETIILNALYAEHNYILVIGSTYTNACKILASVKQQIMSNSLLGELFGWNQSEPWTADTLVLKNGVKIEALGAGQAMRGAKFNEHRPSLAVVDDLEDEDSAATELARDKVQNWFWGVLLPALHPTKRQIIFIGTSIHPESLIEKVFRDSKWVCRRFPILYLDEKTGLEYSSWPERFPLDVIYELRDMMYRQGRATQFAREYLCRAEDEESKPFKHYMIKVRPEEKLFLPTYIVCDPARTVNKKTSSRTGYVCAAWQGNRLIVLDALGAFHMPDDIIKTLFEWNSKYKPIAIGVESNALEEFIRQPLRNAMIERGELLPLEDLRAPRDKDSFIKSLQPFYIAGLVSHTKSLPDLENELLAFPSGRKDVVNALAYLLTMRPGQPIYSDFTEQNIIPVLQKREGKQAYLLVSCRPSLTAACIAQYVDGVVYIFWDCIRYEAPQEALEYVWQEAVQIGGDLKIVAPSDCNDRSSLSGLPAAGSRLGVTISYSKDRIKSEGCLKSAMQKVVRGNPGFLVNEKARWVINGLMGGYSRRLQKDGSLKDEPINNEYQVLIEAIECWYSQLDKLSNPSYNGKTNWARTKQGQRYITTKP